MRFPELKIIKFMEYYGKEAHLIPINRRAAFMCMSDATYYLTIRRIKKYKNMGCGKEVDLPIRGKGITGRTDL
jgi:hypothetical protein